LFFDIKYPWTVTTLTYINDTIELGQLQNSTDIVESAKNTMEPLNKINLIIGIKNIILNILFCFSLIMNSKKIIQIIKMNSQT